MQRILLFVLLVCISSITYSQDQRFTGRVLTALDSVAVEAASIYFDGSTVGTITNTEGYFSITYPQSLTNPLVISALGFKPLYLDVNAFPNDAKPIFYLEESTEELGTVHLETDPWSRKRKMRAFKKEFLGSSQFARKCKILNDSILVLRYRPSDHTLTASTSSPLLITNKSLGYDIEYNLHDFSITYDTGASGIASPTATYYAGTSFFKPLKNRVRRRIRKNRNQAYLGSLLHFMRSLANKQLKENKFRIFHEGFEVPPYSFFELKRMTNHVLVKLTTNKISILYNREDQSIFKATDKFSIDSWGNHSPPDAILTGGTMGKQRIAELVPIDYRIEN